jgi:TonB family protein
MVPRAATPAGQGGESMLSENEPLQVNLAGLDAGSYRNHRREILALALLLLVAVIIFVAVRYRQFWFETLSFQPAARQTTSERIDERQKKSSLAKSRKNSSRGRAHTQSGSEAPAAESPREVVLPPLQVDVIYSDGRHETIVARDSAIYLDLERDLRPDAGASSGDAESVVVNAAEKDSLPKVEEVARQVDPIYPLLAQQMKVQGSVVLQALIGEDGNVQSVQVVSGPEILASAAVEAVRQWRFNPSYKGGRAVPAETRITVKFTISTK